MILQGKSYCWLHEWDKKGSNNVWQSCENLPRIRWILVVLNANFMSKPVIGRSTLWRRCGTATQPSLLFPRPPWGYCCFCLFLNSNLLLWKCKLNVAWGWHVGIDSTMRTVCPTSLFLCLVDLNVWYEKCVYIKALHLGIALCILQQAKQKCGWLHWPPPLSIGVTWLGLCSTPHPTTKAAKWNSLLVCKHILQEFLGLC
jgi:hypothetical protein